MSTTELTAPPPRSASSEEVEPLDYLFFRTEGDPRARSTGMGVEILDRVPDWGRLVQAFDRASRLVVRLTQPPRSCRHCPCPPKSPRSS